MFCLYSSQNSLLKGNSFQKWDDSKTGKFYDGVPFHFTISPLLWTSLVNSTVTKICIGLKRDIISCEQLLGQIGIAFHSPAEPIIFNRPNMSAKIEKVHMIVAQLTIDNSVI